MEKKTAHKLPAFVLGARPPQTLSPKAKRQLSSMKPSKKAQELAEKAAKAMPLSTASSPAEGTSDPEPVPNKSGPK